MRSAYLLLRCLCDALHRKPLASIILYTAKEDEGNCFALLSDYFENIFLAQRELSRARCELNDRVCGIEAVSKHLSSESVLLQEGVSIERRDIRGIIDLVRRECLDLAQDLIPGGSRFVERVNHKVQISC